MADLTQDELEFVAKKTAELINIFDPVFVALLQKHILKVQTGTDKGLFLEMPILVLARMLELMPRHKQAIARIQSKLPAITPKDYVASIVADAAKRAMKKQGP